MAKGLILILLCLFIPFSLYSQTVDMTIIARDIPHYGENYEMIIDNDILDIKNRENSNYIEKVFNWTGMSEPDFEELRFNGNLFRSQFINYYSDVEQNVIYRLTYEKNNTFYVVYGMVAAPHAFVAYLRMFIRTGVDNTPDTQINRSGNISEQQQSSETLSATEEKKPGFWGNVWNTIASFFKHNVN